MRACLLQSAKRGSRCSRAPWIAAIAASFVYPIGIAVPVLAAARSPPTTAAREASPPSDRDERPEGVLAAAHSKPPVTHEASPPTDSEELPEITVSATTTPEPVKDVGSSVTVIDAAQIEREQRRTVPDALSLTPGLNVVQTGGPGGQTSVFIRGTNSNQVKVLIDGIDASDPSNPNGSFDFGQLLTYDIARIEVLRGPQSGLYGADAIGGVISITTKAGEGPPKAKGLIEGGSFGTLNETMGFSGSTPVFSYNMNLAHFDVANTPVTPPELLPPGRLAIGNAYENWTLSTKFGAHLGDNLDASVVARYIDATLRFTGNDFSTFPATPAASQSVQRVNDLFTRGEANWITFGGAVKNRFGLGYTQADSRVKDPDTSFGITPPTRNLGQRLQYDWQGLAELSKEWTLIGGVESKNDQIHTMTAFARTTFASIANNAGYLQLLTRYDDRFFLASNVRYDANSQFGSRATFRFAPSFHVPVTETVLKGSYGTGFKPPTLSQLYVDFPSFGFFGNPNLKPEESTGYDIGFEQPLFDNLIRFGATYYQNNIKNLIDINETRTSLTNIGRAKTYGCEAFSSFAITPELNFRLDYTFTIARDEITGLELLRRPRNKLSMQAAWKPIDKLSLSTTLVFVGTFIDGNRDFSVRRLTAPGYTLVNLAANYEVTENFSAFARIDNLFNVRYQNPTGFFAPGLGAYAGLRMTY
ncbi:MAG: TonB-dependent receptor plug domain-containing protein [Methylocella sp.]